MFFFFSDIFYHFNSLPNSNFLDWSKLKAFSENKISRTQNLRFVGKGVNAGYHYFLLFPQCFQKPSFSGSLKVVKRYRQIMSFNSFPNDKILDETKLKAHADDKLNVTKMTISLFDGVKNTGKRRKCLLPAFSPFPQCFPKTLSLGIVW